MRTPVLSYQQNPRPQIKKKKSHVYDPGNDPVSILIMNNVNKYFNKHPKGKGLWYPQDFFKNLKRKGVDIKEEDIQTWYDGYANPHYFDKIGPFTFKAKKEIRPSDALMAFLEGPTVADCGNATLAIYYKTFLDIFGADEFDKLYENNLVIKFIMDNPVDRIVFLDLGKDYIETDIMDTNKNSNDARKPERVKKVGILGDRPITPGEHLHFGCVKWYANKHPAGFGGGWNVIYGGRNDKGEQIFYAHGFDKPLTEKEINNLCVKDYNVKRTKKDFEYIAEENKPDVYHKKSNRWLTDYYKIDNNEMEKNPEKFLEGFLPHTRVFL